MKTYTATVAFPQWVIEYFKNTDGDDLWTEAGILTKAMIPFNNKYQRFTQSPTTGGFYIEAPTEFRFAKDWLTDIKEVVPEPVEAKEEEVFDWKQAMIYLGKGGEIESRVKHCTIWYPYGHEELANFKRFTFYPNSEYRLKPTTPEPLEPDWDKLETIVSCGGDVKVEIRNSESRNWERRYFCKKVPYVEEQYYCFNEGTTKWSQGDFDLVCWKYCRLWKEGE